ncbi:MAG: hypothetical protein ACI310_07190 [Bacilli bacterium]
MYCRNCGNKLNENSYVCLKCGVLVDNNSVIPTSVSVEKKKKISYGKCLLFSILGALGFYILCWIVSFILTLAAVDLNFSFVMISLPILMILFSPIIALIIYFIKNK